MNLKRVAGGLAKGSFWTATGIGIFKVGAGIKSFGWDIVKSGNPYFAVWGLGLVAAGEVVQICTVVNGVCTFSAALDVVGGLRENTGPNNAAE